MNLCLIYEELKSSGQADVKKNSTEMMLVAIVVFFTFVLVAHRPNNYKDTNP